MPPKLRAMFLTGLANESSTSFNRFATPVIEFASQLAPLGAGQDLAQHPTEELIKRTPLPLPRSVALEPAVPLVSKGKGATLQVRQLWEGTVTDLRNDGFVATLNDRTKLNNPDEQAIFEFIEISEDDRSLISPGSVFYWMIGTERTPAGQIRNVSAVEFRRLPLWSRSSLSGASARADRVKKWFQSEPRPS